MAVLISCSIYSECEHGTLDKTKVKGKIIYCLGSGGDFVVPQLGAAGIIMSDGEFEDTAFTVVGPGTYVSVEDGTRINNYINSTR